MRLSHLRITTLLELKRICNNRRQIAILILGPVIICLIFGSVYHTSPQEIDVAVFVDQLRQSSVEHEQTQQIVADIDASDVFSVSQVFSLGDAMHRLTDGATRAVIVLEEGDTGVEAIRVTLDVTDRIIQETVLGQLPAILEARSRQIAAQFLSTGGMPTQRATQVVDPYDVDITTNEWQAIKSFDLGASGVIVLFVLGICLLMAATAITSERSSGTIERVFASPYKGSVIILSKMLAHSVFAIAVTAIIILTLKLAFDIVLGNFLLVFLIAALVGINAVTFGLLVSSITYSELESVLLGILCWFVFMIMMGFTWPLETMHPVFRYVGQMTPYLYGLHAIRNVNLTGWGFSQAWPDVVLLLGFVLAQATVATVLLRREIR